MMYHTYLNRRSTSIDTAITVHGLTLGVKYQFRVTASLNGISGPSSDPTEPVQVHEPIGQYAHNNILFLSCNLLFFIDAYFRDSKQRSWTSSEWPLYRVGASRRPS